MNKTADRLNTNRLITNWKKYKTECILFGNIGARMGAEAQRPGRHFNRGGNFAVIKKKINEKILQTITIVVFD